MLRACASVASTWNPFNVSVNEDTMRAPEARMRLLTWACCFARFARTDALLASDILVPADASCAAWYEVTGRPLSWMKRSRRRVECDIDGSFKRSALAKLALGCPMPSVDRPVVDRAATGAGISIAAMSSDTPTAEECLRFIESLPTPASHFGRARGPGQGTARRAQPSRP